MYYRINEELTGGYLTADEKRVALLSNPKPAARYRELYFESSSVEEAIRHFNLQAIPETED